MFCENLRLRSLPISVVIDLELSSLIFDFDLPIRSSTSIYVLNRDTTARLTISSPLEAHKLHTIVYSICGVDCGFDNPIFAAIELDYSEADQDSTRVAAGDAQKNLTFYKLDLGLNHVFRKWTEAVDNGANMLVIVPGGGDGPSGMLVCADRFVGEEGEKLLKHVLWQNRKKETKIFRSEG
ncbi:hypothetical protein SO802_006516 [Lithocarpus litseifolius]|uniref:RSE1/DDB1/CPSF1 first beta-propeller domain-containing protein n=1 Tax=Lithocarpus litseifolius TaxID=425828 RepID=A0AAW2DPC4_9ROSI